MLDLKLVKALLDSNVYTQLQDRVTPTIFGEGPREAFELIVDAHEKFDATVLTTGDLMALWKVQNPVATTAMREEFYDLLSDVDDAKAITPEVAVSTIQSLWRRDTGDRIARLGLDISEGDDSAMEALRALLVKVEEGFSLDDFGEETSQDLDELVALVSDDHRFRFNLPTLSRHVYGIGPEEFGIIFATPETGKTALITSLCFGPGGFTDQGCKVMILGNEESTKRTVVRAYQAVTGMDGDEIMLNTEVAKHIWRNKVGDRAVFKDIQGWDMTKVRAYLKKHRPDVVIIDQLDKVDVAGSYDKGVDKLRAIYIQAREVAKEYLCAVIGVSQASDAATGKTRLHYSMMEGSRIGKAAEADLIIGIGKENRDETDDPCLDRYLTVSKNKLSGWQGTVMAQIQPEISRYAA